MFYIQAIILGAVGFVLGCLLMMIIFQYNYDKLRKKELKEYNELIQRNNELIEDNKALIRFNNELSESYRNIERMVSEIHEDWLGN